MLFIARINRPRIIVFDRPGKPRGRLRAKLKEVSSDV